MSTALLLVAFLFLGLIGTFIVQQQIGQPATPLNQRARLIELHHTWSRNLVQQLDGARQWFQSHGTRSEARLFDGVAGIVVENMLTSNSAALPEPELSTFGRFFLGIHIGLVRVIFFTVASFRLWLVVAIIAFVRGLSSFKPYSKGDALGQMGNGRVFYSGAYATLEDVTPDGLPDKLIRGFACPQTASIQEAKGSALWQVLVEYNAVNSTNTALIQILVKNSETAAYVAPAGDEELLARAFRGSGVEANAVALLREVLALHREGATPEPTSKSAVDIDDSEVPYAQRVGGVLRRVLTPTLWSALTALPASEVATLVLGFESGKILAHSFEGERWVRRSNFPHLSARAVLHSLPDFPKDYDVVSRGRIRRALVYAARKSPFSQIRLPVDLDDETLALRQWVEVLLACPHELPEIANELELFVVVREANIAWQSLLFAPSNEIFPELARLGFATRTELLFLPVATVVNILRDLVGRETLSRMRSLVVAVAASQRQLIDADADGEGGATSAVNLDRVYPLPAPQRMESLATMHALSVNDIQDWLVLRYVLSGFGWLASRVGDYTVPETSTIFAVFQATPPLAGANALGRLGHSGMVPLRGSKLREHYGASWSVHFTSVDRVTMAENPKDFEKLMQGIEDPTPSDESALSASTAIET